MECRVRPPSCSILPSMDRNRIMRSSVCWTTPSVCYSMAYVVSRKPRQVGANYEEGMGKVFTSAGSSGTSSEILDMTKSRKLEEIKENVQECIARSFDQCVVREARLDEELWAAAWLRAESYREQQPYVRYVDSYKKKFAEQEFSALKRRVYGKYGQSIRCMCFVAVTRQCSQVTTAQELQTGGILASVVGTLDVSLRHVSPGEAFLGQPHRFGYIANVCVHKSARRKGVASALLQVARETGQNWGLEELYVHVNATNKPARQLYSKKGFQVLEAGASQGSLETTVLLRLQM